uniref:Uncharacterized protein n=1 Tax=Cannabis sativa TaxID=3483 RepID=A0A803PK84_CANSA
MAIDQASSKIRYTEKVNDFDSRNTKPSGVQQSNALIVYYEQCAKFYTREMYFKVVEQIELENGYYTNGHEDHANRTIFNVCNFRDDANMINYYASQSTTHYNIAKEEIARLTTMFKEGFEISESSRSAPAPSV